MPPADEPNGREREVRDPANPGEEGRPPWTNVIEGEEHREGAVPPSHRSRRLWSPAMSWALLAALTLIGLSLLWIGCETHYRACVEAVNIQTRDDNSPLGRLTRREGLDRCNRSPF